MRFYNFLFPFCLLLFLNEMLTINIKRCVEDENMLNLTNSNDDGVSIYIYELRESGSLATLCMHSV